MDVQLDVLAAQAALVMELLHLVPLLVEEVEVEEVVVEVKTLLYAQMHVPIVLVKLFHLQLATLV